MDNEKLIVAVQSRTLIYDECDRNHHRQVSCTLIQEVMESSRLHSEVVYELLSILKQFW